MYIGLEVAADNSTRQWMGSMTPLVYSSAWRYNDSKSDEPCAILQVKKLYWESDKCTTLANVLCKYHYFILRMIDMVIGNGCIALLTLNRVTVFYDC